MTEPKLNRQWNPEGFPPLPKIRQFVVRRPEGLPDELVEATGYTIEEQGVLTFSEIVYEKNPTTGDPEMLRYSRRSFRIWLDIEEIVGGLPVVSSVN